ncbi:MAG: hypothetical protein AMJ58_03920 [Gammaproteobacteria bacterium SG8_30]|nr:MAG: hypothetical protein AMJ58_03920 [Gammaproteobacteria bacterium SG8_30]
MVDDAGNRETGRGESGAERPAPARRSSRAWRWLGGILASGAILSALAVGAFRLALESLPEYEARVAERIQEVTGLRLSFDSLDARVGRYGPEIFFAGARIDAPDGHDVLVTADAGRASLSVFRSLWFRRLEIGRVVLERPLLNLVIFPDRHIELVGQAGLTRPEMTPRTRRGLDRIPRGIIEVRDATIDFVDLRAERAGWQLTRVDLELNRKGDRVSLAGSVKLPPQLGRSIEFDARVEGELDKPLQADWRGRLEASEVNLAGWADLLPATFAVPSAGRGDFRIWASGSGDRFRQGRLAVRLDGLLLPAAREGAPAVTYRRLAGDVAVQRDASAWRISGSGIEFSLPGSDWTPTDLEATVHLADGRPVDARLKARFLRVQNLMPLAALLPTSAARDWIERLAPRGDLRRIDVAVSDLAVGQVPDLRGSLTFEDVGMHPVGRVPGLDGLDGRIRANGAEGAIYLSTRDATMDWPAEWRAPVSFPRVDASLGWERALDGVRLWSDDVVATDGRATATGRIRLLARKGHSPLMDIEAEATAQDISHVAQYMPKDRIQPKPLEWLDAAFLGGRVTRGRVEITGPARGFPYRDGEGRFRAVADVEGVTLRYGPDWEPVSGLQAQVEFDGPSMEVRNASANVGGIRVERGDAEVHDWREGILTIRADAKADAGAAQRFLGSSPLGPRLGRIFAGLTASGPIEGEVVMYLPLREFDDRSITVRARALGVELSVAGLEAPVEDLTGEAWFQDRSIVAPLLRGRFLGGEASAEVATAGAAGPGELVTTVRANGVLDASLLPRVVRLPLDSGLAGTTPWSGELQVQRPAEADGETRSRLWLRSSLVGLASGLPEPLAKPPEASRPLTIDLQIEPESVLARATLGSDLHALLDLRRLDQGLRLSSGIVRLGGGQSSRVPVGPGLRVEGRVPYLSISRLTALRWATPASVPLESLLAGVVLEVGRLEVLGHEFDDISGRLRPGRGAWDVDVTADAASGQLRVPYSFPGEVPLVVDLDRLRVAEKPAASGDGGTGGSGDGAETDPRRLPAMRIDVRNLVFEGRRLGHLSAELSRAPDGLALDRFEAREASFVARGQGGWRVVDGGTRSGIAFDTDIGDVKGFLDAMQLAALMEGRRGRVTAALEWPGGPDARVLERVSGSVRIEIEDGRMLSVEPGAGRLLGLMSLAHLPRRLSLDFDDLTGQGLAFDTIKGDFALAAGEAYTDNLTLRGAAAEIGIAGRTSLKERTYDQTAVVTGDLGASLGVAGAIAGGPAVGAALLLFSQIFKEPLKGVARGYYRISGPWEDPLVRKIDARELEEAAGLGLPPAVPSGPGTPSQPGGA